MSYRIKCRLLHKLFEAVALQPKPAFFLFLYSFIHLSILSGAGPLLLCGLFSSWWRAEATLVAGRELPIALASAVAEHGLYGKWASTVTVPGLESTGSIVVAHGFSCSMACGIFPDQGWNSCSLYWQADSLLLSHQGSPQTTFLLFPNKSVAAM